MKKRSIFLLLLLVFFLFFLTFSSVSATNYYVNVSTGNDSLAGTSPATAWKTISKVGGASFSPGDNIYFERGDLWREQLNYPSSGNGTNPITFGAYGTGASPIITASNLISSGWSKNTTNIWQAADTTQPYIVYFNGTRGTNVTNVSSITAEFNWFWSANVLYVWSPPDSDPSLYYANPGIEAGTRNQAIRTNDKSYVTVDGLTMRDGNQVSDNTVNIGSNNVTGIIFQNCVVERGQSAGFDVKGSSHADNVTINNCTIRNNGAYAIEVEYQFTAANLSNNTITGNGWDSISRNTEFSAIQGPIGNMNIFGNTIYNNSLVCKQSGTVGHYCHGIYYNAGSTNNISANIYNNTIDSIATGSGIKLVGSANVYHNFLYNNTACGMDIGQNAAANVTYVIYSNIVYGNNLDGNSDGICEASKGVGTINLTIENNVLYKNGGTTQVELLISDNLTNLTTIKNNIFWATNNRRTLTILTNQTGPTIIDYNLQWTDTAGGDPAIRYGAVYPLWAQWQSWGYDAHGLNLNPAFSNGSGFMNLTTDFTLLSTSPGINAGTNVSLTTDFLGNTIPSGSAPDIGAYEYQSSSNSTNYYVNATTGNDSLTGTSPATAWKTIAKINSATFQPGDNIYFERGDTWRETLTVPSAGNSTVPITFAAYGSGNNPIINGADNITSFVSVGSNVWNKTGMTTQPNVVIINGTAPIAMGTNITFVNSSGAWYWAGNNLSVYSTSDPSGTVEAGQRNYSIDTNGKNYLTFSGLTIERGNAGSGYGGFYAHFNPSTIIITNCTITQNAAAGVYINGLSPAFTVQYSNLSYNGQNGMGGNPYDNLLQNVLHNVINNNGWAAASLSGFGSGFQGYAKTGEFAYNTVYNNGLAGPDTTQHGFYFGYVSGSGPLVHDNEFYGHTMGAAIKSKSNITIYNNYIHDNEIGIEPGANGANDTTYIIHNNLVVNHSTTALYELGKGTGALNLTMYNNVFYNSGNGGNAVLNIADNLTALDFRNNIVAISSGNRIVWLGATQTGTVNIDYNLYYQPTDSTPFRNVSTEINFTQWQALGYDPHGLNVDPAFSNGSGFMNQKSDFTLKPTSPAIDAGTNVSITQDLAGNIVPRGSAPDLGVYEYQLNGGGVNYYVNATNGNDSLAGSTPTTAWKTIAKVDSTTLNPGDIVYFERGDTWREQLNITNSGNATNQITFTSYGNASLAVPIISGADNFSSWTSEAFSHENFTDATGTIPTSWWELPEVSGNRFDGNTSNNNTLNESGGTLSRVAGPNNAIPYGVQFNYSANQTLNRSDSSLSAGFPGKNGVADKSVTFGAWVKVNNLGVNQGVIGKSDSYFIFISGDGQVVVNGFTDGYGSFQEFFSTLSHVVTAGSWNHIVGRWNQSSGELALFINGQFIGNTTLSTMIEETHPFSLAWADYNGGSYFNGSIAEPFVFSSALNNSQISDIYASGLAGSNSTLYYATLSSDPQQVLEDGARLAPVASKLAMTTGTFWFDSADSRVYIRTFEDANPSGHYIEVGVRNNSIYMNGESNITITNLNLHGGKVYGLYVYGQSSGLDVEGVTAEWAGSRGLWIAEPSATVTGVIIRNDTSKYNGGAGFDNSVDHWTGWLITNNTMNNNCQIITNSSGGPLDGGDGRNWCAGIKLFSLPQTGGNGTIISYNNISNNGISGGTYTEGMGIWSDTTTGITIKYNIISGSIGPGINLEKTINNTVSENLIYNSSLVFVSTARDSANEGGNIEITAGSALNSSGNLVLDNTVYGGWWGIGVNLEDNTATLKNNTITNNIAVGALGHNLFADTGGNNDGVNGSGNVYTYNAFGPESTGFIYWGVNKSNYSSFDTAYGSSTHSISGDPLFTNTSAGNFTLQSSSPAIDAGTNVGITTDLLGNLVPSGKAPDVGAYEYQFSGGNEVYYVNATTGNDSNNGLSPSNPWKTISKINSVTFNPGDNIYFERGDTWREQLVVPSSGNATNQITFGAYGSGAAPIIDNTPDLPNWNNSSKWTEVGISGDISGWNYSGNWTANPSTTYFGANTQSGSSGTTGYPSGTFGNKATNWTCPGTGNQTLTELSAYAYSDAGTGVFRMAIYNSTGGLVAQGTGNVTVTNVGASNATWVGHIGQANLTPNPVNCTGGSNYTIVATWPASGDVVRIYSNSVTSGNAGANYVSYITGFPSSLPAQTSVTTLFNLRAGVSGVTSQWNLSVPTNPVELRLNGTQYPEASSLSTIGSSFPWYWSGGVLTVYALSNPATAYSSIQGTNRWFFGYNYIFPRVFLNGTEYLSADLPTDINSSYRWYYNSSNTSLYVYATQNPATFYSSIKLSTATWNDSTIFISKDYINLSGLEFRGNYESVNITGANHVDISNSTIGLNAVYGIILGGTDTYVNVHNSTIESGLVNLNHPWYNSQSGGLGDGVYFGAGNNSYCSIYNNTISNWNHDQVNVYGPNVTNNQVYGNILTAPNVNYGRGFDVVAITDNAVMYNKIYDNFIYNTTTSNGVNGNNNSIYNNIIDIVRTNVGSSTYNGGFYFSTNPSKIDHDNMLYNNVVYNVANHGIWFQADATHNNTNNVIKNNIIVNWGSGFYAIDSQDVYVGHQIFSNNLFYTAGVSNVTNWVGTNYTTSQFDAASGSNWSAQNDLNADPLFVNSSGSMTQASDFKLKATSPGINAGTNVGITTDFLGNTVPIGVAPDMGAYEYQSISNSTSYYVNATTGNDSLSGTSPATAWKTISKINSATFQPGDNIYFERGDIWRETLTVPSSGNSTNPITFGAYGSGAQPIITGADNITGFVSVGSNVWNKTGMTTQPNVVIINNASPIQMGTNITFVNSSGTWYWAGNNLSVYSTSDPSGNVEAAQRNYSIDTNQRNYLTFDSLAIERANLRGFFAHNQPNGIIMNNCTVLQNANEGIRIGGVSSSFTIQNSVIKENGAQGIYQDTSSNLLQYIINNTVMNNGWHTGLTDGFTSGMMLLMVGGNVSGNIVFGNGAGGTDGSEHGIYLNQQIDGGPSVYNNTIYGQTKGNGIKTRSGANIYNNIIYNNAKSAMSIGGNGGINITVNFHNNVMYGNAANGGADVYVSPDNATGKFYGYNNVLYWGSNGTSAGELYVGGNMLVLDWRNNIQYADGDRYQRVIGQNGTVTIDNNEYFGSTSPTSPFVYNGSFLNLTQWQALGYDTHGPTVADPLFKNVSNNDFTLQSSSPAIDAGVNVGITNDLLGNTVPKGNGYDIGAYEYQFNGGTSYYVNATTGNDSNSGLSPSTPWQTIAKVNNMTFNPGDNIYFERNQTWREQLTVNSSGSSTSPITFGAYGSGSRPIISGSDLVTGWTSEAVGTPAKVQGTFTRANSSTIVTAPYTTTPVQGDLLIAVGRGSTQIGNASLTGWTLAVPGVWGNVASMGIWYKIANSSETSNITLTWNNSTSTELDISEWSNINSTPLDQISSTNNTGSTVTSRSSGTTATTTVASELLYATFGMGSVVSNANFTNSFVLDFNNTGANVSFGATKTVSATGTYETTASWTTARLAGGLIATFKGSGSGSFTAYKKTLSSKPLQLFVNGTRIQQVANKTNLTNGTWYWDAGTSNVYVRTPGDDNASGYNIEASVRTMAVDLNTYNESNIIIQDLNLSQAKNYNVWASGSNVTIQNCTVHDGFIQNIEFTGPTSGSDYTSPVVYDSDVYGAGGTGIQLYGNFSGGRIQRNTVHGNAQLIDNMTGGNSQQQNSAGIAVYVGKNATALAGSDTIISNNIVYNNGPASWVTNDGGASSRSMGIWIDTVKIPTLSPLIIEYNTVYGNDAGGIFLEKTQRVAAEYNIIYNNAVEQYTGNIWVSANSGTSSLGAWVYNNVIYGTGYYAVYIDGTSSLTNLSFENNIISPTNATGDYVHIAGNGADLLSGNILDYNIYGTGIAFNINDHFGTLAAGYSNLSSWQTASGQDNHSLNVNPLFNNASNYNFTLNSSSPAINAGLNLSIPYNNALNSNSTWTTGISTLDQNSYGSGWEIGAYVYNGPMDLTAPTVTLNTPVDQYNTTSQTIAFNATGSDNVNLTNMTLYGNWTGSWIANTTNSSPFNNTQTTFTINNLPEGKYIWNVLACDNSSNCAFDITGNHTFTVDKTAPTVTLPLYTNATTYPNNQSLTFNISVTDSGVGPSYCSINVAGNANQTVAVSSNWCNGTYALTGLSNGNKTINAYANDTLGNTALNNSYVVQIYSAGSWDPSKAVYDNVNVSIGGKEGSPSDLFFSTNGTRMYFSGTNNKMIYQYNLSQAWNLSTASYYTNFSVAVQDNPQGIFLSTDGTKMYMVGNTNKSVYQYTLSQAWNLSTASYDNVNFNMTNQDGFCLAIFFNSAGTKMYLMGAGNDKVYQYTLSQAWNLSTASYDNVNLNVAAQNNNNQGIFFRPDGLKFFTAASDNDSVYQYTLTNAWDLSTATWNGNSSNFSLMPQENYSTGIFFNATGTKMYIIGQTPGNVFQYSMTNTLPQSSNNYTSTMVAGQTSTHGVNWTDDDSLSGYIFSFDNGTGTFVNDTWVSMTGAANKSNVSKLINSTVGSTIRWIVYANDSLNGLNATGIFVYTTTSNTVPPTFSNNQTNTTTAGTTVNFSLLVNDDITLNPNGQYIFSTNNTGTWVNDSAVNFTTTPQWANVTKTLNSTNGTVVGYEWYLTDNAGNLNGTGIFTLTTATTLRSLASARGFQMGAAVDYSSLISDQTYSSLLATQYNSLTPENGLKILTVEPTQNNFNFTQADTIINFSQAHGMTVDMAGPLVWDQAAVPSWINGTLNKTQLLAIMQNFINTSMSRYVGKVESWEVVNEPLYSNGSYYPGIWESGIGTDYIDYAFNYSHAADPSAKLYLNEYGTEWNSTKAQALYTIVSSMVSRGIPINGVGFQGHFTLNAPDSNTLRQVLQQFANLGLEVRISELDVQVADAANTSAALSMEASVYNNTLDACLFVSSCKGFMTWGFTDLHSWIPSSYPGYGRGLPFDLSYNPKPAFSSMMTRLAQFPSSPSATVTSFNSGFENNDSTFTLNFTSDILGGNNTLAVQSNVVHNGTYAAVATMNGSSGLAYASRKIYTNPTEFWIRAYVRYNSTFNFSGDFITSDILGLYSLGNTRVDIAVQGNSAPNRNKLKWYVSAPGVTFYDGGSSFGQVVNDTWYKIAFHWKAGNGTNGGGEFFVNDTLMGSNFTMNWSNQTIDELRAGPAVYGANVPNAGSIVYLDDITYDITNPDAPTVTLNTPVDQYNTSSQTIAFNATGSDNVNLTNMTLYGNWTGSWVANTTNSSPFNNTQTTFTINNIPEGKYIWNVRACDNSSYCSFDLTGNHTFTVDKTAPTITLLTYTNATIKTNAQALTLNVSVADSGSGLTGSACTINANGTNITIAVSSGWCNSTTIPLTNLANGNQTINVYANDSIGNTALNNSYVVQMNTTFVVTNYYVNATTGNDSLAGTSPTTAWKTIAKVNGATFQPGDNIYFEKGDTWRETLTVPSAGNSTNQITFASYGSGASPKILGSDQPTNWTNVSPTTEIGNTLDEGFETPGYQATWTQNLGSGSIIDPADQNVTPPDFGGSYVLKLQKVSPNYNADIQNNFSSVLPITYTRVWINFAALQSGQATDFIRAVSTSGLSDQTTWRFTPYQTGTQIGSRIQFYNNGSEQTYFGPILNMSLWYKLEVMYDATNGWFEWKINGVTINRVQLTGTIKPGVKYLYVGDTWNSVTSTVYADRIAVDTGKYLNDALTLPSNVWMANLPIDPQYNLYSTSGYSPGSTWFESSNGTVTWGHSEKSLPLSNLTTEYDWAYGTNASTGGHIFVYAPSNPSTRYSSVETTQRQNGINLSNMNYTIIDSLDVRYAARAGILDSATSNINNLTIKNCAVSYIGVKNGAAAAGIVVGRSNSLIQNNTISEIGRRGINVDLNGGSGATESTNLTNVTIQNNTVYNTYHSGVDLELSIGSMSNITIRSNYIYQNTTQDLVNPESYIMESIFGEGNSGHILHNVTIDHNLIVTPSDKGTQLDYTNNISIYHNTYYGVNPHQTAAGSNIWITKNDGGIIVFKNNLFYGNVNTSVQTNWENIFTAYTSNITSSDYNLFYQENSSAYIYVDSLGIQKNYKMSQWNTYKSDTGFDAHSPTPADPLFVNAANGNFSLRTGSPAIDAGVSIPGINDGYTGSAPDIGAFEGSFDLTPPTITLPIYTNATTYQNTQNLTFNISVTDSGVGPSYCSINVAGNANQTVAVSSNWCNGTYALTGLSDGNQIINAYANDSAGNIALNNSYYAWIDTTAPIITLNNPINSYNSSTNSNTFSANLSSAIPINYTLLYGNFSGPWAINQTNTSVVNGTQVNFTVALPDGYYIWTYWSNDSLGNNNFSANRTLTIDTTAPTITLPFYTNATKKTNAQTITLNISASDSRSGLTGSACLINVNGTNITVAVNSGWCNSTTIPLTNLADGNRTINVYVNDTLNNLGLNNSYVAQIITTDAINPTVTLNTPSDQYNTTSQTIAFNATASDNVKVQNMTLYGNWTGSWVANTTNSSPFNNTQTTFTINNLPEGRYIWNVLACDNSSNCAFDITGNHTFTVDKTVPTITSPANATINYLSSLFSDFNAADSGIGVDNSTWNVNDTTSFQINSTGGLTNNTILQGGVYVLNITVKDLLGNGNYTMYKVTVNQGSGNCNVLLNETSPVTYPVTPKVYTDCTTAFTLYRNGTSISNNTQASLSAGTYNFTVIRTDQANYSSIYNEKTFQINKATPSASLTNDKAWTREYDGTNNSIGISETNLGDSDVTYVLFRNGTNKGSSDSVGAIGVYSYKINTTGGANYSSTDNMNTNNLVIQDTTKPFVSIVYPTNISYNSTRTQLNYSATDLLLSSCWYTTNGGVTNSSPISSCANFTGLSSSEGSNSWTVWTNDSSNNRNYSTVTFIQDTVAPVIALPTYTNLTQGQNTTTLTLSISVSDPSSGVIGSACLINANGTNITVAVSGGWCNTTAIPLQNLSIGNHTINIYANDTVNNLALNNSYYVQIVSFDVTPPTVTLNTPVDNYNTTNQTIAFNATASENVNLTNMTLYGNWTGSWVANQTNLTPLNGVATVFTVNNLPEGRYIWNVRACDNSSNCDFSISNKTFAIDKTAPTIALPTYTNLTQGQNTTTLTINVSLADSVSGFAGSACLINANGTNITVAVNSGWCNSTTIPLTNLAIGSHVINIYANDTVNNLALNNSYYVQVIPLDVIPPTVTLNTPVNQYNISSQTIAFNATGFDDINLTNMSLYGNWTGSWVANVTNSSPFNNTQTTFAINNLPEGRYIWNVRACDNSSNCAFAGSNNTFTIDLTAPMITLPDYTNATTYPNNQSLTFNISVTDLGIGASYCSINVAGNANQTLAVNSSWCNGTYALTGLSDGNQIINAYANDTVGNIALNNSYFALLSTPSSGSSGGGSGGSSGGGGGGGGSGGVTPPSNQTANQTVVVTETRNITVGNPGIFTNFSLDTGIKQIEIYTQKEADNISIAVSRYNSKPADVPITKSGKVYLYLHITPQNLGTSLENATVTFNVNKSWADGNSVAKENIFLFKYYPENTSWNQLNTEYLGSDNIYYKYQAELTNFSYFAIGEQLVASQVSSSKGILYLVIIIVLVILILVVLSILIVRAKRHSSSKSIYSRWQQK